MSELGNTRFKIGAVERLTGIPASSIRIWERRHAVVAPQRSSAGTRYYTSADVERLKLIRELTEAGDSISEIANLSEEALRQRRQEFRMPLRGAGNAERILLLGAFPQDLREGLQHQGSFSEILHFESPQEASRAQARCDVLILHSASLHREDAARLHALRRDTGARAVIVVYRYASRQVLRALDAPEIELVRAPVRVQDLLLRLQSEPDRTPSTANDLEALLTRPTSAPHFNADQLARIASLDSAVRCECPQHLADLIASLQSFEQYSAECESRTEEDAALHARLYRGAALCRDVMEQLLHQTLEAENLLDEV